MFKNNLKCHLESKEGKQIKCSDTSRHLKPFEFLILVKNGMRKRLLQKKNLFCNYAIEVKQDFLTFLFPKYLSSVQSSPFFNVAFFSNIITLYFFCW